MEYITAKETIYSEGEKLWVKYTEGEKLWSVFLCGDLIASKTYTNGEKIWVKKHSA